MSGNHTADTDPKGIEAGIGDVHQHRGDDRLVVSDGLIWLPLVSCCRCLKDETNSDQDQEQAAHTLEMKC